MLRGRLWFTYAHLHAGFQEPSYTRGPRTPGYGPRGPPAIRMNRRKQHWPARRVGHPVSMRGGLFPKSEGRSAKGLMLRALLRHKVERDTFILSVCFRLGVEGSRGKGTCIVVEGGEGGEGIALRSTTGSTGARSCGSGMTRTALLRPVSGILPLRLQKEDRHRPVSGILPPRLQKNDRVRVPGAMNSGSGSAGRLCA